MTMNNDSVSPKQLSIAVGDLEFDSYQWGPTDGAPLLAMHGFPQHGRSWEKVAPHLATWGIRTIAVDQRGYSSGARAPLDRYRLKDVVDDVVGIADALRLQRFHLAGFGQGALQSWATAARYPDRVNTVSALRFPHPAVFADAVRTDPAQGAAWAVLESMSPPRQAAESLLHNDSAELRRFLESSGMEQPLLDRTVERLRDRPTLEAAIAWHLISVEEMAEVPPVEVPSLYIFSDGPALLPATAHRCHEAVHSEFNFVSLDAGGHWLLDTSAPVVARLVAERILGAEFEVEMHA